jgi:hypothetical protein
MYVCGPNICQWFQGGQMVVDPPLPTSWSPTLCVQNVTEGMAYRAVWTHVASPAGLAANNLKLEVTVAHSSGMYCVTWGPIANPTLPTSTFKFKFEATIPACAQGWFYTSAVAWGRLNSTWKSAWITSPFMRGG